MTLTPSFHSILIASLVISTEQLDEDLFTPLKSLEITEVLKNTQDYIPPVRTIDGQHQKIVSANEMRELKDEKQFINFTSNQKKNILLQEQVTPALIDNELHNDSSSNSSKFMNAINRKIQSTNVDKKLVPLVDDRQEKSMKRKANHITKYRVTTQFNTAHTRKHEARKKKKSKHKDKHKENKGTRKRKVKNHLKRDHLKKIGILSRPTSSAQNNKHDATRNLKEYLKISDILKRFSESDSKSIANLSKMKINEALLSGNESKNVSIPTNKMHNHKLNIIDPNKTYIFDVNMLSKSTETSIEKQRYKLNRKKHKLQTNRVQYVNVTSTDIGNSNSDKRPSKIHSSQNDRIPLKPVRSKAKPPYYIDVTRYDLSNDQWPDFSLESIKHGQNQYNQWLKIPNMEKQRENDHNRDNNYTVISNQITKESPNFPPVSESNKETIVYSDKWPNFPAEHISEKNLPKSKNSTFQKHLTYSWSPKENEKHRTGDNRLWHHFAFHRVTTSPLRARPHSAYVAISVVTPPGKPKVLHRILPHYISESMSNSSSSNKEQETRTTQPMQDKMDLLLALRSQQRREDPLEEQLIDAGASTSVGNLPWSHVRHLGRIQEQMKTLSDVEKKIRHHMLENERLHQILQNGVKNGTVSYGGLRDNSREGNTPTISPVTSPSA